MKIKLLPVLLLFVFICNYSHSQNLMYGSTLYGGLYSGGTIVSIDPNGGQFSVRHNFSSPDGFHPYGKLFLASDGNIYGTCFDGGVWASCTIFRYDPNTSTYLDVHSFDITHGDYPRSGVIEGTGGILYGVATSGGVNSAGVLYSWNINTNQYSVLHDFNSSFGSTPVSSPLLHSDGKLYGVTSMGGSNNLGVIYSFDPVSLSYTVEHNFDGTNGSHPETNLMEGIDGKLYGVTLDGGINSVGTLFSFDPQNSQFTKLHDFALATGGYARGGLIQAPNGTLYGVCTSGAGGQGGIYSFNINTLTYMLIYSLAGLDGSYPIGELFQQGNVLSGTCSEGDSFGAGNIFNYDLTTSTYTKVFTFNVTNGSSPNGSFISVQTTGIPTISDKSFGFFPSPSHGQLHIDLPSAFQPDAHVEIYNIQGKLVWQQSAAELKNYPDVFLNVSSGIYSVVFESGDSKSVKKLVVLE